MPTEQPSSTESAASRGTSPWQSASRLQLMERLFDDAQRVAHFGCWEWQVTNDVVTWSDEMYRICGLEPGQIPVSFALYLDWQHPDDRAMVEASVYQAYRTKSSFSFEHRVVRPDGDVRTVMCYGDVELDETGEVQRMFGTGQDITEQKRLQREREQLLQLAAEQAAAQRGEARYRALVEASTKVVWRADRDGRLVEIPLWRQLTGQSETEIHGDGWLLAIHPEDRDQTREMLRDAQRQHRTGNAEFRLRLADGAYRWFHARTVPVLDEQSNVVEWIGTFTDVHERKTAADTLALFGDASRGLLSSLDLQVTLDNLAKLLVPRVADYCHIDLVDDPGRELLCVAAAHVDPAKTHIIRDLMLRYPPTEQSGRASPTAVRTGEPRLLNDIDDVYYQSVATDDEHLRMIRAIAPRSYIAVPLVARGRPLGAMVVVMSESGRRYGENDLALVEELGRRASLAVDNARLYAAERRARAVAESASRAKSDMLAVMSHELRTPLNAIVGYTNLIGDEVVGPVNDVQREQLERVRACAAHLLQLIEQVLTLSRLEAGRESVQRHRVNVGLLCHDAVSMLEPAARLKGLRLEVTVAPEVGECQTDETKLRQIILNLLSNAVKFTEAGVVSLDARREGSCTSISVRDTGIGIDAEHLEHVFERFWQVESHTSRRAKGTGLGLSVSRDLARLLGGDIQVESVPDRGSTFTLRLTT